MSTTKKRAQLTLLMQSLLVSQLPLEAVSDIFAGSQHLYLVVCQRFSFVKLVFAFSILGRR